jgi:DNA-binding CsgD family transcriptional regulator/PAS domain-containing protein
MLMRASAELEQYSDVIGAIYDCAVSPRAWPAAVEKICQLVNAMNGVVLMVNIANRGAIFQASWNANPDDMRLYSQDFVRDNPLHEPIMRVEADVPYNIESFMPRAEWEQTRLHLEFGNPRGWVDMLGITFVRTQTHTASLALVSGPAGGLTGPRELQILRLLSPHLRRAALIADILGGMELENHSLRQVLDTLGSGVMLVGADGNVLFANEAAGRMLANGLEGADGSAKTGKGMAALRQAVADCANGDTALGAGAIAIPLETRAGAFVFAHVLPLASGEARLSLRDGAAAAVFLCESGRSPFLNADVWASAFGITAAEARVLDLLVAGFTVSDICAKLEIALPTARSHIRRLHDKTGCSRLTDLILLVTSLTPPLAQVSR